MDKHRGIVKFFDDQKGYGFIRPTQTVRGTDFDGTRDVFVHISDVQASGLKTLAMDMAVAFMTGPGRIAGKGPRAIDIDVLASQPAE